MVFKNILLWAVGLSSGLMVSAGVFTLLFVVGLVPRFAGRTNTAWCDVFYEECLVFGAIAADAASVFPVEGSIRGLLGGGMAQEPYMGILLTALLVTMGAFAGIFTGCLSIALAEVLDGIPIFARRVKLKMGLSTAVLAVALGKVAGALVYFIKEFYIGIS